jgi:MurNAc alpha-1-phosphate uridylyltransferase
MDTAMIFAAGRGERMRPLTDHTPKPLLCVGGKPLIVWQIEALARAGIRRIVINHAWLGEQFAASLGDGSGWGVSIRYSAEGDASLETAGGIAKALPLILSSDWGDGDTDAVAAHRVFIAVAGDVFADFDYSTLRARAGEMAQRTRPGMHLVMVPNPDYHPRGDFAFDGERLTLDGAERVTFASFGLYDTRTFETIAARTPLPRMALLPFFREAISSGRASAEVWTGRWANVGTVTELEALNARLDDAHADGRGQR